MRTAPGKGDGLIFVEHVEPVAFLDRDVLDVELRLVPLAYVRTLVHNQGTEVPRVEQDDVGGPGIRVEVHERRDQGKQG
jgi:hypothetical protein